MSLVRLTGWLRPVAMLLALTGTLGLTACGGGSGAVNGPSTPTTPIATLYTLPAGIVVGGKPVASYSVCRAAPARSSPASAA